MLLLATQAEPQMRAHRHPNLGRLLQPRHYPRAAHTARSGVPWAADNDAFNGGWDQMPSGGSCAWSRRSAACPAACSSSAPTSSARPA